MKLGRLGPSNNFSNRYGLKWLRVYATTSLNDCLAVFLLVFSAVGLYYDIIV